MRISPQLKKKRCVGVGELTNRLYHQVSWQTTAAPPESIWLIFLGTCSTNIYQVQVFSLCQMLVDILNNTGRALPQRTGLPVLESETGQADLCSFRDWGSRRASMPGEKPRSDLKIRADPWIRPRHKSATLGRLTIRASIFPSMRWDYGADPSMGLCEGWRSCQGKCLTQPLAY